MTIFSQVTDPRCRSSSEIVIPVPSTINCTKLLTEPFLSLSYPVNVRNRRHAVSYAENSRNRRFIVHPHYHKLKLRLKHGADGFLDISYTKSMYEYLQRKYNRASLTNWTANFLSSKGYITENDFHRYTTGNEVTEDLDFLLLPRLKRSSLNTTLEALRLRRENHMKISYCCVREQQDSDSCSEHLCNL